MSFDFDAAVSAPHRMQPGLRRLAPGASQLTPTVAPHRGLARHLREKLAVLGAFRAQAMLCVPGFDARPALAALAAHAAAEQPDALRLDGAQWLAPGLGWALDGADQPQDLGTDWPEIGPLLAGLPADWRRAGLLCLTFAEDFAVLDGATATLPWLAVALPSMWAPEQKIGRHFAEVHAPVADNRLIVGAAGPLVKLATGDVRWERFVWTLTAHPRLHGHPQRVDPARWAALAGPDGAPGGTGPTADRNAARTADRNADRNPIRTGDPTAHPIANPIANPTADPIAHHIAAHTWWRTERQTFIPVPGGQPGAAQAVFTILVNSTPLCRAFDTPGQAARVHQALASMSPAVLAYRGLAAVQAPLLRWLAWRAAEPAR